MRDHKSPDPRFRLQMFITIHSEAAGWTFRTETNWTDSTTVELKPACLGDYHDDFEAVQLCILNTDYYRGEVVNVYKKCYCGRPCVLKINHWCPEDTLIQPNVPIFIAELEVAGFHLQEGKGQLKFLDPFIATTPNGFTARAEISSDTRTQVVIGNEEVTIKGISVEYFRVP